MMSVHFKTNMLSYIQWKILRTLSTENELKYWDLISPISPSSFVSPLTCQDWRVDENISVSSLQHYKVNQVTRSYKRRWFCKHNFSPQQPDNWCLIHTGKFQPKNRHFCTVYATFLVSKGLLNRLVLITLAFIDWKYNYFATIRVDWMTPRLHEPTL